MKLEGSKEIAKDFDSVWAFVTDAKNMAECMPDVKEYKIVDPTTIEAKIKVGVGFIKETFDSVVKFAPDRSNKKILIALDAKTKSNSANVKIDVSVDGDSSKTSLKWNVDAIMAGRLASIGQRYISKVSDNIIEKAFGCMASKLSA